MWHSLRIRFMFWTTVVVLIIVGGNFLLDYQEQKRQMEMELREKARVITHQFLAIREFMAHNQDRINYDSQGHFEFKHLNPAAVGRGVGKIFNERTNYSIKQTRLKPRIVENAPDRFEIAGLQKFREQPQLKEYWGQETKDGKRVYRYMVPLKIRESCLPCHGKPAGKLDIAGYPKEGYELGQLGGAVSVTLPMDSFLASLRANTFRHLGFFLILAAVILAAINFLMQRLVDQPLDKLRLAALKLGKGWMDLDMSDFRAYGEIHQLGEQFQDMARQLKEMYERLEEKVKERTTQLRLANEELKAQREILRKANRELEKANELKSQFLASMSHELRTPLTSIIAFSELMLSDLPEGHETQRENLQEIRDNGTNLLRMIDNLLDLAKIESGHYQINLEVMDLVDVVGSVERMVQPIARKKNVALNTVISDVPLIKADPDKVHRILLNLVGNAVKFTPPGGRVDVTVRYDGQQDEVVMEVADTGIGISKENQEIIFERFRQVDGSDSRKYKGTGLGLALAKELTDMHRGKITVDSQPGRGSIFTVRLPVNLESVKVG
ncbi:MAG: DUF3365 domain-containing protein [Thermoanaerobacteraceae bacterium]|nr:DUF3365 domain-containing protein [Thermoanaerobacteraceae bacterium]